MFLARRILRFTRNYGSRVGIGLVMRDLSEPCRMSIPPH